MKFFLFLSLPLYALDQITKWFVVQQVDPDVPRVNIATDTGGVQARRAVEALIAAEKKGAPKRLEPLPLEP